MNDNFILVGLEGRALQFSGWCIHTDEENLSFWLGDVSIEKNYLDDDRYLSDFKPINVHDQVEQVEGEIVLSPEERVQGEIIIRTCVDSMTELSRKNGNKPLLAGIGMPGLKSNDQRGVLLSTYGPRIPDFCDRVEAELKNNQVELIIPITKLGSDVEYCGMGEEYSVDGAFSNYTNCYFLGGGTGAGDALKLDGELIPLNETKSWMAKTWELVNDQGFSLEKYASTQGIQSIYSEKSSIPLRTLVQESFTPKRILELACQGDPAAIHTFQEISKYLAELIYERIVTIYSGWQNLFEFNDENRPPLSPNHPYQNILLNRIVFGQHFGALLRVSQSVDYLWDDFVNHLTNNLSSSSFLDDIAKEHYIKNGAVNPQLIHTSSLTESSILGAGIDAFLSYKGIGV